MNIDLAFNLQQMSVFFSSLKPPDRPGPHSGHVQWVMDNVSPGVNRPRREADQSNPPSTEVRNAWYNAIPICL
jgi:hypothetical protein